MRKERVKEKAREIVNEGKKPSATLLAQELDFALPDIHRCLNSLEKQGEIETYMKEVFGTRNRMVGVKRQ